MRQTVCFNCGAQIEYDDDHVGKEVECGGCHKSFLASEGDQSVTSQPGKRRRRPSNETDWDTFDSDPEYYYEQARQLVKKPGLWLIVGNCLSIGLMITSYLVVYLFFVSMKANAPAGAVPTGVIVIYIIVLGTFGMMEVIRALLGFLGGRALSSLNSQKMAMTGAVASLIPLQGLMSVFFIPFGIWSLVTIQKPVVKWAFDRNRNRESERVEF